MHQTGFIVRLTVVIALVYAGCSRPPAYIRVAGGDGGREIRAWQLGEVRPCVNVKVTFNDGVPDEPILICGTEEGIDNMIDLKKTGLLHPVGQEERTALHKEPVLAVTAAHPEKEKWRCRKTADGLTCVGEDLPAQAANGPSLEEERLATWARNLPDSSGPFDKLCKDTVKTELEIAAYNRTHPPNDQKGQVTDVRKLMCGGPDGPGEKPKQGAAKSQAPSK